MRLVISLLIMLFGTIYLLVALFMALFIGLMAYGGSMILLKSLGVEL
jgi:hypothetical protein